MEPLQTRYKTTGPLQSSTVVTQVSRACDTIHEVQAVGSWHGSYMRRPPLIRALQS